MGYSLFLSLKFAVLLDLLLHPDPQMSVNTFKNAFHHLYLVRRLWPFLLGIYLATIIYALLPQAMTTAMHSIYVCPWRPSTSWNCIRTAHPLMGVAQQKYGTLVFQGLLASQYLSGHYSRYYFWYVRPQMFNKQSLDYNRNKPYWLQKKINRRIHRNRKQSWNQEPGPPLLHECPNHYVSGVSSFLLSFLRPITHLHFWLHSGTDSTGGLEYSSVVHGLVLKVLF